MWWWWRKNNSIEEEEEEEEEEDKKLAASLRRCCSRVDASEVERPASRALLFGGMKFILHKIKTETTTVT